MKALFQPSQNCHRLVTAHRAAIVIDGENYFRALHQAFRRATSSIFIVGWDLHSEVRLIRDEKDDGYPACLGALLDRLADERPGLQIYLLSWDFAMIYAMEREFFPRYKLKWQSHDRVHFGLDGHHPVGASQHQKMVVIDDALAFAGGLDLSQWRWDTPQHNPQDDRRIDPEGQSYPPFHDVQMAVDGPAAAQLGKLVRERWRRSEGNLPDVSAPAEDVDPWPSCLTPDFRDIPVAIARTLPQYKGQRQVGEVRQLYLDSIAAARHSIYIENQYLSAHCIGEALAARLEEKDGPEVVVVMPDQTGGWLEQHTMDVLRGRLVSHLRAADHYERLRIYYARLAQDPLCALMVHAKVMIIDDVFLRVGSANLSNRSMGFDAECDLAIAAEPADTAARETIAAVRARLIGEHLGKTADEVMRAVETHAGLIKAVESLQGGTRTLVPLDTEIDPEIDAWVPESDLLDPEEPVAPDKLVDQFVSPEQQPSAFRHAFKILILMGIVIGLAALWRWTPLGEWIDIESARAAAVWMQQQPLAPLFVTTAFLLGGLIAIPVTLMIIATVVVFGPWQGLLYSLAGSWLSAVVLFAIGRWMGRDTLRRFAGSLLNRVSRKLSEKGLLTVITFRIVPVAPFSVINLIAGVSEIRWRDYALGTLIGMLPGVIAVVVLADRIAASLYHPDLGQIALLLAALALVGLGLVGLRRWIRNKRSGASS